MKKIAAILIAVTLLAGLAFLCLKVREFSSTKHELFQTKLWRLKHLDTAFNEDMLKARFTLQDNYDDFDTYAKELKDIVAELKTPPVFIGPAARKTIEEARVDYDDLLQKREKLFEQFKSQNARLSNSRRYLPTALDELAGRLGDAPADHELAAAISDLTRLILMRLSSPDELADNVQARLNRIHDWCGLHPDHPEARFAASLVQHAQIIIARSGEVDALTRQLLALPTDADIQQVFQAYQSDVDKALRRAQQYRAMLYLLVFITVVGIGYTLLALRNGNRRLEKRVEERTLELATSEERFRLMLANVKDYSISMLDADGRVASWNAGAEHIKGYTAEEIMGQHFSKFYLPKDLELGRPDEILRLATNNGRFEEEGYRVRKDGSKFMANVIISAIRDKTGKLRGFTKVTRDVTERKRAELELNWKTAFLEALISSSPSGVLVVNEQGKKILQNRRMIELWKIPRHIADDNDDEPQRLWVKDRNKNPKQFIEKVSYLNAHPDEISQDEIATKDELILDRYSAPVTGQDGKYYGRIWVFRDITERKRSEEMLRLLGSALEQAKESILITDADLNSPGPKITFVNPAFTKLTGYAAEEVIGKTPRILQGPRTDRAVLDRLRQNLGRGEVFAGETINYRKDGGEFDLEWQIAPLRDAAGNITHFMAVQRDITERKRMEVHLLQSQKLESVGQLAAGIAHEINTPMQYVGDNTRFVEESFAAVAQVIKCHAELVAAAKQNGVTPELLARNEKIIATGDLDYFCEQIPSALKQTLEGVERVTKIVRAMKEFSHPGGSEKASADLNRAIESTVTVAHSEWKYVADLKLELEPELPHVPCFLGEFNQCILNLVVNASHAIGDVVKKNPGSKGTITVQTRLENDHVVVRVTDTGTGIPDHVRPKIFEPFFTTKDVGKGTGQGLSIVYGSIVKRHGGTATFETETGKGTTFIIRLPIHPATTTVPALA